MNQTTILTQKRYAHVSRNNLRNSLRQSLPVLNKSLLSSPKHTYGSIRANGYRPLGSATEEFPLPRLVKETRFTDVAHKDEREPDLVLRVNVYPTISDFRSLEGVLIELQGSSKRFCEQIIGAVDPRPELMLYIRYRLRNSPFSIKYALLNQQKRWINEWQESYFDSACQKCTKSLEDSSDRLDKVMAEGEQRKQSELEEEQEEEEEDELGETGDDEMEEDEEVLNKADNKKNRRGKKSQRARLEKKLRKAKEDKDDAKFGERNRRPLYPSPPQSDAATLVPGMEFEDEEDWIVYSDKRTRPSRASNAPVVDAESAIKEELEEAAQEPVIKLPPAISNTDEQALQSKDFNVQDSNSNSNAPPDQGLEEPLPSPVIRLPPSAANSEDDSQEALSSPVEQPFSFAASKEIYLGDDQEFVVVRLPSYVAPSTPKKEDAGEWDEVSGTKDKRQVKNARTKSPIRSPGTPDTHSQEPPPLFPGAPQRSPVQTSGASSITDVASQIQEENMSETMGTLSNDEQLDVQERMSPSRSGTRRHSPIQTSEAYSKTDAASQNQEEDMSETLSAFSNDEQLEVQESMSPSRSGTRRRSPVQASEASSKTHVASQIQEEDMSETLSTLSDDEQLDIREWIRKREEALTEEIRQMEEEFAAKNFSKYYDAALHTSHGNRRASDPGPFSPHFSRTTTSDHKPAPLGLSSGLDDKETVKSVESESEKGEETSSSNPGKTLIPPPGLGPPDPQNMPPGFPSPKCQNKPPSRSKPNPQNPSQNVYHQPYYQYPQPLQYDPAYGFQPTGYMGFYGQYPQQQMYEMPLHLALNQQHLFDPNQPAVQWPTDDGTDPAQENPSYPAQENPSYPAQENPLYPHHWQ